ncbi:unnamed protein product [Caenorhabditis brenneri]
MDSIENRKEAMLKRLASRNEERILKSINQNQTNKKIDLRATEKAFLDTSPTSINMKTPVNPNFTISAEFTSSPILSFDEKADKQIVALATWTNTMIGIDSSEELDLGATAAEACRRIQKMLSKKAEASDVQSLQAAAARLRYRKVFEKNDAEKIKKQCRKLLEDSGMEQSIRDLLSKKCIAIKNEIAVYSDLSLQTTLFRTFLCFHPAWLKAALEAIFNAKINAEPKFMIRALSQFFIERVFSNPAMLKNKKFAQGSGVPIITAAGKEALHRHFLEITMKMLFLIETAYAHGVIPNLTRIFTKSSHFKSMNEIFSELTRELLTGSSADFKKAFARIGFQPTYKQSFIESYNYQAEGFEDFSDGLILAKLIETVGEMPHGKLLLKLRDPAGDRLRKVNNVKTVLQEMTALGINTEDVTAAAIVGGKKDAILAVLWSIVGVRVAKEKRVRFLRTKDTTSEDLTTPKKKRRSGVHDDMSSEVLKTLKVIGRDLKMEVLDLDSLLDGLLLNKIWTTYVPNGTSIESYPGDDLWAKIVSLTESELAIPRGLDQNVALFVKMYLERVQMVQMYNEKATKIQKMWKAYLWRKNPPKLYHIVQQVLSEHRRFSRSSSPFSTSQFTDNATFTVQNASPHNNSTLNDATFTVSRTSMDSDVFCSKCLQSDVFKMPRTPLRATFTRTTIAKHLNEAIEEEEEIQEGSELIEKEAELEKKAESVVEEVELPVEENDETLVPSTLKKRFRVGHVQKTVFEEESESGVTTIEKMSVLTCSEVIEDSGDAENNVAMEVDDEKENSEDQKKPEKDDKPSDESLVKIVMEEDVKMENSENKKNPEKDDKADKPSDNSLVKNGVEMQQYLAEIHVEQQESKINQDDSEDVEMVDVSDRDEEKKKNTEVVEPEQNAIQSLELQVSEETAVEKAKEVRTPIPTPRTTISSPLPVSMDFTQPHSSESSSSTSSFQPTEDQKRDSDFLKSMIENQKRFVEENNLNMTIADPKNIANTPELRKILREAKLLKRKQEEVAKQLLAIEKRALAAKAANVTDDDDNRSDAGHDDAIILEDSEIPEDQLEKLSKSFDFMNIYVEIERKNEETARILAETREKQRIVAEKECKSAVIIQKIVRGFLIRRRFRLEILNWRDRMIEYNKVLAIENEQFERDDMKDSSVERKLRKSTLNGLTNSHLHIVNIAATIIDRITDLVPNLLEKFVVELNGIQLIYDILAVADQGLSYTSILHPLLRILQKCFHVVPEEMTNDTIHPLLPKLSPRLFLLMRKHANNRDSFIPIITTLISIGRRFPHKKDSHLEKWENQIEQTMKKVTDQEGTNYLITLRHICDNLL